ncbi:MAG TPA: hypothetical protein VG325_10620, partial [Solirubrobacteraceae bacterium]|nr:hypothetical protein [Solirubrobacteraceae bacterium]
DLPGGRSVVVLGATAAPAACSKPAPRLTAGSLGPVRLGMTRRQARSRFPRSSTRRHRYMDFFCPARRGIRVAYASPSLLRSQPRAARHRLTGRVVLILTAAEHYSLRGVHVGTRLARVARRLHAGAPSDVGRNRWYVVPLGSGRGVLKVQHGVIEEIGIANRRLTTGRRVARRFFTSFS